VYGYICTVLVEYWTATIQYESKFWVKPEEVGLRGKYTLLFDVITF
jgi:hypothetical protein